MDNSFGSLLRQEREKCGLFIEEAESKAEIPKGYLANLESDKYSQPSTHALWKLSEIYGADLKEWLVKAGIVIKK